MNVIISLCIFLSACILPLSAVDLTADEAETLLAKVEALEEKVVSENQKNQRTAISVFLDAIESENKVFDLYLKCKEKVSFEDQKKKSSDARDYMRRMKSNTSKEYKVALQHQLYWLVHSIEASRVPEKRDQQAKKLLDGLVNITADHKSLDYNNVFGGPLRQDPFNSVFAKAYKLDHLRPKDWPQHPLDFDGLFLKVIVKSLIDQGNYSDARKQWVTRIKAEDKLMEAFAKEPDSSQYGKTPVILEKYREFTVPALMWKGEQALFEGGDRREAAVQLFQLLEKYPRHPQYLNWVEWFKKALTDSE